MNTCPDCGGPKTRSAQRCLGCHHTRTARTRACPDCGGPKSPAAQRCLDCHHTALTDRRQQRIEAEEALIAERRRRAEEALIAERRRRERSSEIVRGVRCPVCGRRKRPPFELCRTCRRGRGSVRRASPAIHDEFVLVLDGEATLTHIEGERNTYKADDTFLVPKGLHGRVGDAGDPYCRSNGALETLWLPVRVSPAAAARTGLSRSSAPTTVVRSVRRETRFPVLAATS